MAKHTIASLALGKLEYGTGAPSCTYDGVTRYIRITDIDNDGCLGNDFVSPKYYEDKHLLKEGDILFARTGATVGKTYLYHKEDGRCVYAGFLIRVIPNQKIVLPSYLYYFTKSKQYLDFVASNMKVVAQPNINAKQYGAIELFVPNIDAQKDVVSSLDKLSQLIFLRKKQLQRLDDLVKSHFFEMFGDPSNNPKGYPVRSVSTMAEYWNGLTYKPEDVSNEGTVVLRSSNIQNMQLDFTDTVRVNCKIGDKKFVRDNDILMCSRNGSAKLVGKVALIHGLDEPMSFGAFMMLIRSEYYPYLMMYFQLPAFRSQITTGATTTINQITSNMMNKVMLPIPDKATMNEFAAFVSQVDKSKLLVQQGLNKLEQMKQSLMQKYFG